MTTGVSVVVHAVAAPGGSATTSAVGSPGGMTASGARKAVAARKEAEATGGPEADAA